MADLVHKSDWTDQAIYEWKQSETKMQPGLSADKIFSYEALLDFKFPQDFIEMYKKVNGFAYCDMNTHMFSFWSLDRILEEYKTDNDSSYIGFCDFLINSYSIGFSKKTGKIYKHFDRTKPICDSFEEAVFLINSSSGDLY